jgi:hypothetical protein
VSIDRPTIPRLAAQLLRDIQNRTVKLNNLIWPLILQQNQSVGDIDDTPFVDLFTSSPQWIAYKPKIFRLSLIQKLLPTGPSMSASCSQWKQFWKLPVEPAHRSLWYRLVHKKLYSQTSLSHMNTSTTSAECHFCSCAVEEIQHLLVRCPRKWAIWIEVFNYYCPHLLFTQDDICSLLWPFKTFHFVDNQNCGLCVAVFLHIFGVFTGGTLSKAHRSSKIRSLKLPCHVLLHSSVACPTSTSIHHPFSVSLGSHRSWTCDSSIFIYK